MAEKVVAIRKVSRLEGSPASWPDTDLEVLTPQIFALLEDAGFSPAECRGKRVLIHPNLVRPNLKKIPASSTDPRVIIALAKGLRDWGAAEIQIGENPGFGFPARLAFRESGLVGIMKHLGVELCCFDEGEWCDVENPRGRLYRNIRVAKPVLDADVLINVPKLKTHMLTGISLSIKNLLGIIHDDQRMLFHRNDIIDKIVDLSFVRPPDINIIDGIWAMEGQAPFNGNSIPDFNVIMAGRDMVSVDSTAADIMGFDVQEIPHLVLAKKRIWDDATQEITIVGDSADSVRRRFKRPVLSSAGQFDTVECIECGVCNGCLSAVRHSLDKIKCEIGFEGFPEVTVVSGRPMPNKATLTQWNNHLILFGNCAAEFQFYEHGTRVKAHWIPGCPPHVLDLLNYLDTCRDPE